MTTYKIAFSEMRLDGKIPSGDPRWSEFNGSFHNVEWLKSDIASAIYDGYAFTTWHKNRWRKSDNYELGQHIGLDFDAGDLSSSIPYLAADKFVYQYAAMVYSTPSSTPEMPKSRVLFVLDTPIYQPRNYVLAVRSLLWVFGTADEKCKDPCRFFYGSRGCEVEFINHVLPLEIIKKLISQYQATGEQAKEEHTSGKPVQMYGDPGRLVNYWQRRVAEAPEGERNDTLNKAAYSLGQMARDGNIHAHDVRTILEVAARQAGLDASEIEKTINSGLRAWV